LDNLLKDWYLNLGTGDILFQNEDEDKASEKLPMFKLFRRRKSAIGSKYQKNSVKI